MPIYEFRCKVGHITEALVAVGTATVPCGQCAPVYPCGSGASFPQYAYRILSPTRTTFEFADCRRRRSVE